jgi:hypothetical protein
VCEQASPSWRKRVDLRQHKRYRLVATVDFEWESADGSLHKGAGRTRDISAAGVFIMTPELLPSGISVNLVVNLPSLQDDTAGAQLKTQGHVVRAAWNGFAVIADMGFQMKFSDAQTITRNYGNVGDEENTHQPEARSLVGTSKVFTVIRYK